MKSSVKVVTFIVASLMVCALTIGAAQAQDTPTQIGNAPVGQTAIEFIGQIDQNIFSLTSYGYITHMGGIPSELLFADGTIPMFRSENEARFTFMATGTADGRSNYENIFAATTSATFNIYYNETPAAATFDNPESFAAGTLVASFEGRLYSMLNVQEPNIGVLLVHSDTVQVLAEQFTLASYAYQIGQVDTGARFTIFGQGFRESTDPLSAYYHVAGDVVNLGMVDAN